MVATVGGAGLTTVIQSLMPMLSKVVNDIVLPRMDCYRDHCEVAGLQYQVDEIRVKHFSIGEVKVAFIAGKGLQLCSQFGHSDRLLDREMRRLQLKPYRAQG